MVEGWGRGGQDREEGGRDSALNGPLPVSKVLYAAANLSIFSYDNTLKYIIVVQSCLIDDPQAHRLFQGQVEDSCLLFNWVV